VITFVYEYRLFILDKNNFEIANVIDLSKNIMDRIPMGEPPIVYDKYVMQRTIDDVLHVYERQD
jgi:hypothetical protein